jgi:membrane protease YdiL (CAAX protease family)
MAGARISVIVSPPSTLVVVLRLVLTVLVYLAVLALLAGGLYLAGLLMGSTGWAFSMLGLAIAEGGAFATVLVVWKYVDHRKAVSLGLRRERAVPQWLRGALVGTLMMCAVVFGWFVLVDGAAWTVNDDATRAAIALITGFIAFFVQGPSEEVLFRGYVLENVRAKWGVRWAIGVSSLAFSLLHAPNPGFGVVPFINLLLFGVAMALWKLRIDAGQLWGVFAIHTMWNWLQQVVFGLPNSGQASPTQDTLFSLLPNTNAPDVLWGGGFGPEGTLGATLVLLALIAATLRVQRQRL